MRRTLPYIEQGPPGATPTRGTWGEIDLANENERVEVEVTGIDSITWTRALRNNTTWPATAVLSLELSNDAIDWFAVPGGAVTFSTEGMSESQNVFSVKFARLRVTTPAGTSPQLVRLTCYGEGKDSA